MEDSLPQEGPHAGAGEKSEESSLEMGVTAETMCDELSETLMLHPPAPPWGEDIEKIGSKVKPRNTGDVEGRWRFF